MMLTLDRLGKLMVYTPTGSIPIEVECLDDIHRVIEKYQIDYIAPEMNEPHLYTADEKLLGILDQFHMQRAYGIMAAALVPRLPQA